MPHSPATSLLPVHRFSQRVAWMLTPVALFATGAPWPTRAGTVPVIVRRLDTRPDKGNHPATAFVTGPHCGIARLYNDDVEVSFWNQPEALAFNLNKNDVWDRRYFCAGKRLLTLEDVRRACFAVPVPDKPGFQYPGYGGLVGRNSDLGIPGAPQALYLAYDFPCPKPVGQLLLRCPDLNHPGQYTAGATRSGGVVIGVRKGAARVFLHAFLCRTWNVLVVEGHYDGIPGPLRLELYRHQDTTPPGTSVAALANRGGKTGYDYTRDPDNGPLPPPEAGADGRYGWIRQRFPAEPTFPAGFESVLAATVTGVQAKPAARNGVRGGGVKATIHPVDTPTYRRLPGWLKEVRLAAERVNAANTGALVTFTLAGGSSSFVLYAAVVTTRDAAEPLRRAKDMLKQARRLGPEELAGRDARLTESDIQKWRVSRVMHYNATSCTYYDATPWHGDYHFNEGYFLPTIVNGDLGALEQRLRLFEQMLPALRRNAREVYKCGGICFPLVHYPIKADRVVYTNVTWEWGIENTAFMIQPFWQIFQYTWDKEFLRTRAYPMMKEAAQFYTDYLKKGADGYYHVIPTVSQEHWGFTPHFVLNRDSVGALSFVKYHLRACLEASRILGVDAPLRARWGEILARLAPYPMLDTPAGPVFCDVRDAPRLLNYNITANLVMVLFAEDISLDSPPDLLETARRSYRAIPDKEQSMRKSYLQRIRLYLGMLERPWLCPQGRVLSWPGRIHLYAGVPRGVPTDDQFTDLLAVGGFKVSARHAGKEVRGVRIHSSAGNVCRVKNPWYPGVPHVFEWPARTPVPVRVDGDTFSFSTRPGQTYALLSDAELPRASMWFVPRERIIARWTFDASDNGRVPDLSGNGHDAELVDGARLTPTGEGAALHLPGNGAFARVPRTPAFDFGAGESFSLEAKVKIPDRLADRCVPVVCSMATKQYCLFVDRGRVRFYLSSPRGRDYCFVLGKVLVADGRWHTVRAVRDAEEGVLKVFVDGELDALSPDATTGDFAATAPLALGAYLWGEHSRYMEGLLDEVTIRSLGKLVARK